MRRSPSPSPRAFTLVELMAALAIGGIIVAAAITTLVVVRRAAVETGVRNQLDRDAQRVVEMLDQDLRYFGVGVPSGTCESGRTAACQSQSLLPVLRRAGTTSLAFLGDQPYPNAELPGVVSLTAAMNSNGHRLAVTSEVSGDCLAPASGAPARFQCDTTQTSRVPANYTSADKCDSSNTDARTCAWAMGKWLGAETHLTVVRANLDWYARSWAGDTDATGVYTTLHVEHTGAPNADMFSDVAYAFAAQLDRVLYSFDGGALKRRQCWGSVDDPGASDFPSPAAGDFTSTLTPTACAVGTDGTDWETVATGVESLAFTYFQNPSTPVTSFAATADFTRVRLVQVDFTLARAVPGATKVLRRHVKQMFFLQNRERDTP